MKGATGVPTTITVNPTFPAVPVGDANAAAMLMRPSRATVTHARVSVCAVCTTLKVPTVNAASQVTLEMPHSSNAMSVCATFLA